MLIIRRLNWRVMAIVSACVFQVFFFVPLQLFLNNITEFPASFASLFFLFLLASSGLIVVLYFADRKLPSQIFLSAVTFLSVVAFIESKILFGFARHRSFDGTLIDWEALSTLSHIGIAVILGLTLLIVVFRQHQGIVYSVSLFILLFHGIGFLHATITKCDSIRQPARTFHNLSPYFRDCYRLSRERNVIHIVPDNTPGALMYEIVASDLDRYSEVFDGFTLFTRLQGAIHAVLLRFHFS